MSEDAGKRAWLREYFNRKSEFVRSISRIKIGLIVTEIVLYALACLFQILERMDRQYISVFIQVGIAMIVGCFVYYIRRVEDIFTDEFFRNNPVETIWLDECLDKIIRCHAAIAMRSSDGNVIGMNNLAHVLTIAEEIYRLVELFTNLGGNTEKTRGIVIDVEAKYNKAVTILRNRPAEGVAYNAATVVMPMGGSNAQAIGMFDAEHEGVLASARSQIRYQES